jgi:hypothetical protein
MSAVLHALRISAVLLFTPCAAVAVNPAQWFIVEELRRGDTMKTWTSPTAIDLDKMVWEYGYEITQVTATVNLFGAPFTEDITDSIPEEDRIGAGESRDLPAVLLDETISEPESGTSAHVFMEVDDLGFGQAVFSDIMLGSVNVPIFGRRPIERINVEARIDIIGYDFGDYDRSGQVNADDYALWRSSFGQTGPNLAADGNGDESVDAADYVLWRANFGAGGAAAAAPSIVGAVPEPSSGLLLIAAVFSGLIVSRTKRVQVLRRS